MASIRTTSIAALALLTAVSLSGCGATSSPPPTAAAGQAGPTASSAAHQASGASAGGAVSAGADGAHVDCGAFAAAVHGLFPGGASAPSESEGTCTWGIGSNATAKPADIANTLQDVFALHFTAGDDAETQYGGNVQFMGGANHAIAISGVGTAAVYIAGENGVPNVSAWSGTVSCGSTLFISDAKTVGLTSPGGGKVVAGADAAALAKRIADACAIGWSS